MLVAYLENHPYCHVTGIQVVETSYFFGTGVNSSSYLMKREESPNIIQLLS